MRTVRNLTLALLLSVVVLPRTSQAVTLLSEDPIFGDSWSIYLGQSSSETWVGSPVGPFDYIRIDWVSGATFEPNGLRNLSGGWVEGQYGQTGTFSWASRTGSLPDFTFYVTFNDPTQATVFEYRGYTGNTMKQAQRISTSASGGISNSSFVDIGGDPGRFQPVPEPSGLAALIGGGVLALLASRKRRR